MVTLFAALALLSQGGVDGRIDTIATEPYLVAWDPGAKLALGVNHSDGFTNVYELGDAPKLRQRIRGERYLVCSEGAPFLGEFVDLLGGDNPPWAKAEAAIRKAGFGFRPLWKSFSGPADGEFLAYCAPDGKIPGRNLIYENKTVTWAEKKPAKVDLLLVRFGKTGSVVCGIVFPPEARRVFPRDRISIWASRLAFDPGGRLAYLSLQGRVIRIRI